MYQSLSRKFRPQTFHSVCGQKAVVTTLKNALKFKRVSYAYLFCGSRGTGKTTLARLFAKALNCVNLSSDQEPCNSCPSCIQIQENRSLDVLEIDGASNRGIDDIRSINDAVGYSPSGNYKIYIIDEVHMLTKEAFNALLKTLEEPPSNVKFLFATTEPHKVPPTILSRCQRFDLSRLSSEEILHKLQKMVQECQIEVEYDALSMITHLAEGGLRDAESLLDQLLCYTEPPIKSDHVAAILGLTPRSLFFKLDEAIYNQNFNQAFEIAQETFSQGREFSSFLDGLLEHFRTHLILKLDINPNFYLSHHDLRLYQDHSHYYTQDHCFYILDFLMSWHKELSKIPFKRLSLEMILLHLIRSKKRISLPSLIQRIEELKHHPQEVKPLPLPLPTPPVEQKKEPPIEKEEMPAKKVVVGKDQTLLRFAAIELEGTV